MPDYKRVIIAGPRDPVVRDWTIGDAMRKSQFNPVVIITGGASGIDQCAYMYASVEPKYIGVKVPARWDYWKLEIGNPKPAGPERNGFMADMAEALIVIKRKDKNTPGTFSMMEWARRNKLPIYVHEVDDNE